MKQSDLIPVAERPGKRDTEQGSVRPILLPLICFALGLAASMLWVERPARPAHSRQPAPELSESTKELLAHLNQPIEIHFYSLLDPSAPASLGAFSRRVEQLLSAYQQQARDKIVLTRFDSKTNASPDAALADGIKGFNLDQGEGCFLGATLASAGKKEVLEQLLPEWESALEADVSRAIHRLMQSASTPSRVVGTTPPDARMVEEIKSKLPDITAVSLEDGIRTLREDSVKEFTTAGVELQARVQEAQARLVQAKKSGSTAEQDGAMKELQAAQTTQAQRLKEIAASAQARIDAFKQLKAGVSR